MSETGSKDTAAQPRRAADAGLSVKIGTDQPQRLARRSGKAVVDAARARAALYRAVEAYIRLTGGTAVAIGGVEVQRWDVDRKHKYRLAIHIVGKPPHYAPPAPPDAPQATEGRKMMTRREVSAGKSPRAQRKTKLSRRHPGERA